MRERSVYSILFSRCLLLRCCDLFLYYRLEINHPRLNQVVPQTTQQEQNSHTTDSPNAIDQPIPQPDPVQHRARENCLYSLNPFLTSSLILNATLDVCSSSLQKLNEAFVGSICLVCNVE